MATQIQWRRGNTAQTAAFTGVLAEVTVDTDKKTLVVHDGTTAGGIPLAKEGTLSTSYNHANGAFDKANSANVLAQSAFDKANQTAQLAFTTVSANGTTLTADANNDTLTITSAVANGVFVTGISGSDTLDIGLIDSGVTASGYGDSISVPTFVVDAKGRLTSASNTTIRSGTTSQTGVVRLEDSVTSTSTSNAATPASVKTAYDLATTANTNAINAGTYANAAFDKANSANVLAQAGFDKANTATTTAGLAYDHANGAFDKANTATTTTGLAYNHANGAFDKANTATTTTGLAYDHANGAFIQANSGYNLANSIANNTTTAGTANVANYAKITTKSDSTNYYIGIVDSITGNLSFNANSALYFNPGLRTLVAPVGQFGTSVTTTSLLPSSTIVTVFNTTATTIRMGGEATTINIGNVNGTTAITGNVTVSKNVTAANVITTGVVQFADGTQQSTAVNAGDSLAFAIALG